MIFNLFSYPSNFGKVQIYKCDLYGNALSLPRLCFIDNFNVTVNQTTVDDELLIGNYNQSSTFKISNRDVKINADFLFSNDLSGTLNPAIDLLINLSAWAYQGTTASFNLGNASVSGSGPYIITASYNQTEFISYITGNNFPIPGFNLNLNWYAVGSNGNAVSLTLTSIDQSTQTLYFSSIQSPPSDSHIEAINYGIPLNLEPMFRIDTSEGSFYPCLLDSLDINLTEDFVKISSKICSINYDRSFRFDFINATKINNIFPAIKPIHKSRVRILDFQNDIANNFLITDLSSLQYMNSLITQTFNNTPIENFSLKIENSLQPVYANIYQNMQRTFVKGFYSKNVKIGGTMSVLNLRSSQPTFDRYPVLSGVSGKSLSLQIGNQIMSIPMTVWTPGKLELKQNDFATLSYDWKAITRIREGQPIFNLYY